MEDSPSGRACPARGDGGEEATADVLFKGASFMGDQEPYMAIIAVVYLCVGRRFGFRLLILWLVSACSNAHLKDSFDMIFDNRRPYEMYPGLLQKLSPAEGPAFPSGHAQSAAVVWGAIAHRLGSWPSRGACVLVIALIAFSRLYNAVHWPRDVVGGLLIGLFLLIGYIGVMRAWQVGKRRLSRGQWAAAIIAASALTYLLSSGHSDWIMAAGTLLGAGLGYLLLEGRGYEAKAPFSAQVLKAAVALTVLFGLYFAGEKMLGEDPAAWARALLYALMGFTVAYLLPMLFIQFRAWRSRTGGRPNSTPSALP